jgi:glutamate dehydrogenase (NADP+)
VIELGGRPVTLSDSSGWVHDSAGIDRAKLEFLRELKGARRGRLSEYAKAHAGVEYTPARDGAPRVWSAPVEVALPCATQNELTEADAAALVAGGAVAVAEGANMPTTPGAVRLLQQAGVLFAPGKASNAGGVATSGLEMTQNAQRMAWQREQVDRALEAIVVRIHRSCAETAARFGRPDDYVFGANVAGFLKVADAMRAQGVV